MTQQHASERRPRKIDLNLLPSEYRPPKKSYLGLILYMVVFVLVCALAVVIVLKVGVDGDVKTLNQDLTDVQQQLAELQANKAEADPLNEQIAAAQAQLENMETDYQSYIGNRSSWSQIIAEIDDLVPGTRLRLQSISTSATKVTISGISEKRNYVYDYVVALEDSDLFYNIDFTFGDCPDTDNCNFTITAPLDITNQNAGETDE